MNNASGVTDLDAVVTQWAKKAAQDMHGINPKKVRFEISWDRVKFTPLMNTWTRTINSPPTPPTMTMIYTDSFKNNTDYSAQHNLKVERSSKATVKAVLLKGFSVSKDLSLPLDLPDGVSEAAAAFGRVIQLDQQSEETVIQYQQSWSVDTQIPAPPRSVTHAKVDVKEHHWSGNFTLQVRIKGTVVVSAYERNASGKFLGEVEDDIVKLLQEHDGASVRRNANGKGEVHWTLEGKGTFDFGVEQVTSVEHETVQNQSKVQQENRHYPSLRTMQ